MSFVGGWHPFQINLNLISTAPEDATPDGPAGDGRPRVDAPRPLDGPHGGGQPCLKHDTTF